MLIGGPPGLPLDFRRQWCLKPFRCQRMTVSGWTKTKACRHSLSIFITVSQKIRSPSLMCGRATVRL